MAGHGHVIVALDEDELIMANKGLRRPIFSSHERAKALLDLKYGGHAIVDDIEFFQSNRVLENIIRRLKPDILLKGSDWEGKKIVGEEFAGKVVFFPRQPYSTTDVIARVVDKYSLLK